MSAGPREVFTPTPSVLTHAPSVITPTPSSVITPTPSVITPTPSVLTPAPSVITIKFYSGSDVLEVTGVSATEQRRLTDKWLARHAHRGGQALQFAVYGKGNRITVVSAGEGGTAIAKSDNAEPEESRFWTWRRIGAIIVGLATIVGAVAAILALHPF